MRYFVAFIVALLIALPVQAQTCAMPSNPTTIRYGVVAEGAYAFWYCDSAMRTYEYRIATFSFIGANPGTLDAFVLCLTKNDCAAAHILNAGTPQLPSALTDTALLAVQQAAIKAANDYRKAVLATYIVAKNGIYADRPAYPIVNGVRATTATGRAAVGAACDCSLLLAEGATLYCRAKDLLVAVCAPK